MWFDIAALPILVMPGLIGAVLSSAIGSILGAPRTLEALSVDRVVPRMGPRTAHAVSTVVALAAVALGDLNAVAPILTMFFLTTYGVVNLVAGIEQLSGAPSYRPQIHVPWYVSLAGAAGCIWVMGLINPIAAFVAVIVEMAIYLALRRRALSASWGDLRYGALLSLTRASLLKLRRLPVDPRNWRPHILVFVDDPKRRIELLRFASWLNQDRGILTVSRLIIGDLSEHAARIPEVTAETNAFLDEQEIVAFAETEVANRFDSGVLNICQANGIAGLTSNSIMFGWSNKPEILGELLRIAHGAALLGKSTILCRIAPRRWGAGLERIDVWWGGLEKNGDMMLLFAHLVSLNREWRESRVTMKTVASNAMTLDQTERSLRALVERCRIKAETRVIERVEGETVRQIIQRESRETDLVFLGLRDPEKGTEGAYVERLLELVGDLPTVILVRAAGPFAGQLL